MVALSSLLSLMKEKDPALQRSKFRRHLLLRIANAQAKTLTRFAGLCPESARRVSVGPAVATVCPGCRCFARRAIMAAA